MKNLGSFGKFILHSFLIALVITGSVATAASDSTNLTYVEPEEGVPSSYIVNLMKGDPQAYFNEINSGWPKELYASLESKLQRGKSYIVFHNRLPFTPIDLRSTENFKLSLLASNLAELAKMDLGHVMIGWHCESESGVLEGVSGFTGELNQQSMGMMKAGWGFSGLFSLYNDGHLQTPLMVQHVMEAKRENQIVSLAIEVENSSCKQLTDFVGGFVFRADKPYRHFGLNADPAKFEGGGCGSFGVTAAGQTGIFPEIFPHFWRTLYANKTLLGYDIETVPPFVVPYRAPYRDKYWKHKVDAGELIFKNWSDNPGPSLRIMDPEMLYLFQETVFRDSLKDAVHDDPALARRLAAGPFVRNRSIKGLIFRRHPNNGNPDLDPITLDQTFDAQSTLIVKSTKAWLGDLRTKGYSAKPFEYNGRVGILLSR